MCAGVHHPTRGGTRGGKDQFDWDDVKTDKDRECYLGHSVMAPVGRWQKGKDLTWYTKKSKTKYNAILEAERAAVKQAEEDAMAAALGLKPAVRTQKALSKQEAAEVFRRQSQDDKEGGEDRMKGVGYSGRSQLRLRADSSSNDLKSMFEHDTSNDVSGSAPTQQRERSQPQPEATSSSAKTREKLRAKLKAYLEKKDRSKKKKKEKNSSKQDSKKSSRHRRASTSTSESEEEWVEAHSKTSKRSKLSTDHPRGKRQRSDSSDYSDIDTKRKNGHTNNNTYTSSRNYHREMDSPINTRSHGDHHRGSHVPRKHSDDDSDRRQRSGSSRKYHREMDSPGPIDTRSHDHSRDHYRDSRRVPRKHSDNDSDRRQRSGRERHTRHESDEYHYSEPKRAKPTKS